MSDQSTRLLDLREDDRGSVYCALDNMDELGIKRTYVVENFSKGMVRAWHLHLKGDTYFHVVRGALKVARLKYDPKAHWDHEEYVMTIRDALDTAVLTERTPKIFKIPAGYYNGAISLTDNTKLLVYSTLSFEECKNDDMRLAWHAIPNVWEVTNR